MRHGHAGSTCASTCGRDFGNWFRRNMPPGRRISPHRRSRFGCFLWSWIRGGCRGHRSRSGSKLKIIDHLLHARNGGGVARSRVPLRIVVYGAGQGDRTVLGLHA